MLHCHQLETGSVFIQVFYVLDIFFIFLHPGKYLIQKVVPQASGESSKVKVKVRVNIHGIFSVSSASLVEVQKSDEAEEPMETEQVNDKEEQVHVSTLCSTIKWT